MRRLGSERDVGVGVPVDVLRREVIRKWGGDIVVLPLARRSGEWILERVSEGAGIVLAVAWIGAGGGNRALVQHRFPLQRRRGVNDAEGAVSYRLDALRNGVYYAVIDRVAEGDVMRFDVVGGSPARDLAA